MCWCGRSDKILYPMREEIFPGKGIMGGWGEGGGGKVKQIKN
jgi:hypothetical protein